MLMRNHATRAGPVVDHHLLVDALAQLARDAAYHHVRRTARRKFHHDAHSALGIFSGMQISHGGKSNQQQYISPLDHSPTP